MTRYLWSSGAFGGSGLMTGENGPLHDLRWTGRLRRAVAYLVSNCGSDAVARIPTTDDGPAENNRETVVASGVLTVESRRDELVA